MTGSRICTSLEWCTIIVGASNNIFSLDYNKYGHLLPRCWIQSLWRFCWEFSISLPNPINHIQMERENDDWIMKSIIEHGFSKTDTKKANRCRLYLQVHTLSDITNGKGNQFNIDQWNGIINHTRIHNWPTQSNPSKKIWRVWRRCIRKCHVDPVRKLRFLQQPLGKFYNNNNDRKWFFNPSKQKLYERKKNNNWLVYERLNKQGRGASFNCLFQSSSLTTHLPNNSHPATIINSDNHIILNGWNYTISNPSTVNNIPTDQFLLHTFNPTNERPTVKKIKEGDINVINFNLSIINAKLLRYKYKSTQRYNILIFMKLNKN